MVIQSQFIDQSVKLNNFKHIKNNLSKQIINQVKPHCSSVKHLGGSDAPGGIKKIEIIKFFI